MDELENPEMELAGAAAPYGGQTTISPPAKRYILTEVGIVLASGVDSLTLAIDFCWRDASFFKVLDELRNDAMTQGCPMPGLLNAVESESPLAFEVKPFGKDGYQWLLTSPEYAIKLGNWLSPQSRPSAMIDIRCEALWMRGVIEAVDRILTLLMGVGAHAKIVKVSRVDVCLDLLVQDPFWCILLSEFAVTRARNKALYQVGPEFTGIEIGGGNFRARMYDKDLEIRTKSHKDWMYDIWNLYEVPKGFRAIRVEFQIRREALKELGIDTVWHFTNHPRNLWSYCTHCWLKFTDNPGAETRFQEVLPFWKSVQEGFLGGQCGAPLIRAKAVNVKKKQLAQQMLGQFTSLIAIDSKDFTPDLELEQQLPLVAKSAELIGMDDASLSERVRRKQGKYLKAIEKFKCAEVQRSRLGLPHQPDKTRSASVVMLNGQIRQ